MKERIKKNFVAVKKYLKTAYSIYYAIIMFIGILIIDTIIIGGPLTLIVYYFFLCEPCEVL